MKFVKILRKNMILFMACILAAFAWMPQTVKAAGPIEVGKDVTLEAVYLGETIGETRTPVVGAPFHLYKVAEVNEYAEYIPTAAFENYAVEWNGLDSAGWKALAETLSGYVSRDGVAPTDSVLTGEDGTMAFPTEGKTMTTGLYLLVGEQYTYNDRIYRQTPVVISLPNLNTEDEWVYDIVTELKFEMAIDTEELEVRKIWKNDNAQVRPESINVQLLKDGEVVDTVALSKDNNWFHAWTELDKRNEWQLVEEEVPEGYEVSVERDETTYVITNTYKEKTDEPPKLPQTGLLWWPVPVLAALGMVCFYIGWAKYFKRENE